jgi:hypothetical protein
MSRNFWSRREVVSWSKGQYASLVSSQLVSRLVRLIVVWNVFHRDVGQNEGVNHHRHAFALGSYKTLGRAHSTSVFLKQSCLARLIDLIVLVRPDEHHTRVPRTAWRLQLLFSNWLVR